MNAVHKKPERTDWHTADIKCALAKKGWTFARIARDYDYAPNGPNMVMWKPWPVMEQIVADLIGVHPSDIWPSRYDDAGAPLRGNAHPTARRMAPENALQNLFELRGESMAKLAAAVGIGQHSVQKVVKGVRSSFHVQQAIADYLCREYDQELTADDLFGEHKQKTLRRLLEIAIDRKSEAQRDRLISHYIKSKGRLANRKAKGNV
jgi:Ner family transcriptional regulator